jgi:malonyl-CoA O-methyltransferase
MPGPEPPNLKQAIAQSFGDAAPRYHQQAKVQHQCAGFLLSLLQGWPTPLPGGKILEIGCGTGFVTQGLIEQFPDHDLEITDLSVAMLDFCRNHLQIPPNQQSAIEFHTLDGEFLGSIIPNYSLIISNFVIQWFEHYLASLQRLFNHLQPNGLLVFSFPSQDSFPEWRQVCQDLDLPFTANPLPDTKELLKPLIDQAREFSYCTEVICCSFPTLYHFFHHLKQIGADVKLSQKKLSPKQFQQLTQAWISIPSNQRDFTHIKVSYHAVFVILQR